MRPRVVSTAITLAGETAGSVETCLEVMEWFGVGPGRAREIVSDVRRAVSRWRAVARGAGLTLRDCDRMASAFLEP